ncbi:MAG: hypothetical protein KGQ37_00110 [Hyphomicrobiales bacterium]|nr:hypothetical protein [Hyphomicrobiales bacterium]
MSIRALNPLVAGLAIAALGVALPLAQAEAHDAYYYHHHVRHHRPVRHVYRAPPQVYHRVCVPLCPQDTLPCDPINFKIADGRCDPWY